jgi:hypothetical protein
VLASIEFSAEDRGLELLELVGWQEIADLDITVTVELLSPFGWEAEARRPLRAQVRRWASLRRTTCRPSRFSRSEPRTGLSTKLLAPVGSASSQNGARHQRSSERRAKTRAVA